MNDEESNIEALRGLEYAIKKLKGLDLNLEDPADYEKSLGVIEDIMGNVISREQFLEAMEEYDNINGISPHSEI